MILTKLVPLWHVIAFLVIGLGAGIGIGWPLCEFFRPIEDSYVRILQLRRLLRQLLEGRSPNHNQPGCLCNWCEARRGLEEEKD